MTISFDSPIEAGAVFSKSGEIPFELILSTEEGTTLTLQMSNADAMEILDCLKSSFSEEST